jgi:hypothetical protein
MSFNVVRKNRSQSFKSHITLDVLEPPLSDAKRPALVKSADVDFEDGASDLSATSDKTGLLSGRLKKYRYKLVRKSPMTRSCGEFVRSDTSTSEASTRSYTFGSQSRSIVFQNMRLIGKHQI